MQVHLFGASTPSGHALKLQINSIQPSFDLFPYSRSDSSLFLANFLDPDSFRPGGDPDAPSLWISFGPIWLLAPFLQRLREHNPQHLGGLRCVIACSSSSVITKRFAVNSFDRDLVKRLIAAEDQLISVCQLLNIPCRILRPTLIYGRVGPYVDRNLSRLIGLMRRLPFLLLPSYSGLRQPIHASQLASVSLALASQFCFGGWDSQLSERISLGGDSELSYATMLRSLQLSLSHTDPARSCRLISIPSRLFYAAASPLLLQSPKSFEAVLRMGSDLSGFTPVHQLLNAQPQSFPVLPLL